MRFLRRRHEDRLDEAKRAFREMLRSSPIQAETPVDVAGESDDAALDDHVWMRVSRFVDGGQPLEALSEDVRAYFVTRSFEWEMASGGLTGFLDWHGKELAPFIAPGYRRLGLGEAAEAFESLWSSSGVRALLSEVGDDGGDIDREVMMLADAVGTHDDVRRAFIRTHPHSFSI